MRIQVTGAVAFRDRAGTAHDMPAPVGRVVAPLLDLIGQVVVRADAFKSGELELAFGDGSVLLVPADPDYEPWTIAGEDNGLLVVYVPGGEPAIWSGRQKT